MTLVQLQVLVAIVEAGGFTTAAERLGMTQSAVSHALAAFEQELGVTLLERGRQGPRLTAVGERILAQARAVLARTEHIRQEAAAARGVATGKLRVGSFPSVSARLLPGILRQFTKRYPGVEVVLFEGTDDEVHTWIVERVVDIGVVTQPTTGIMLTPLLDDELVAVVALDDPLAQQKTITAMELAGEPFILSKAGCEALIKAVFQQGGAILAPAYAVRDVPTILAMVREGLGVTIVPRLNLPEPPAGLQAISLSPPAQRQLALGIQGDVPVAPVVQAFLDEARQWMAQQDWTMQTQHAGVASNITRYHPSNSQAQHMELMSGKAPKASAH